MIRPSCSPSERHELALTEIAAVRASQDVHYYYFGVQRRRLLKGETVPQSREIMRVAASNLVRRPFSYDIVAMMLAIACW